MKEDQNITNFINIIKKKTPFLVKIEIDSFEITLLDQNQNIVFSILKNNEREQSNWRFINTHPVLFEMDFPKVFSLSYLNGYLSNIIDFYENYDIILDNTIRLLNENMLFPEDFCFYKYPDFPLNDHPGFCLGSLKNKQNPYLQTYYPVYSSKNSIYILAGRELTFSLEDFENFIKRQIKDTAVVYKTKMLPYKIKSLLHILQFIDLLGEEKEPALYSLITELTRNLEETVTVTGERNEKEDGMEAL